MIANNTTVKIFMLPQQFPCGPQSSCCGPIGQTVGEIQNLKDAIEAGLGCTVEVIDIKDGGWMKDNPPVIRIIRSFGAMALPIIALNGDIVSMGKSSPDEAVIAIREKRVQV